jgi:hypothetical protein
MADIVSMSFSSASLPYLFRPLFLKAYKDHGASLKRQSL